MRDERVVPFDGGTARVLKLADAQELEAWQRAFQGKPKSGRYYELIEQTLANDFEFRYLVLEDEAGNVSAVQSGDGKRRRYRMQRSARRRVADSRHPGEAVLGRRGHDSAVRSPRRIHGARPTDPVSAPLASLRTGRVCATAVSALSPACHHYVSFLLATAYGEPYEVLLGALLPCFWIYAEVGSDIQVIDQVDTLRRAGDFDKVAAVAQRQLGVVRDRQRLWHWYEPN